MRKLEHLYPDVLLIIGVESGKFPAERVTENVRQALLRLEISHPVVNDRNFRIWRGYGVEAWPTLILIGPEGEVQDVHVGEISFADLDRWVSPVLQQAQQQGLLTSTPPGFVRPERFSRPASELAFPGKVLAVPPDRLFIADTNHHRLLEVILGPAGEIGKVRQTIGSGRPALADGNLASSAFHYPQGLAFHDEVIYLADSGNHAIRAIDLRRRQVETIAGTGEQARVSILAGPGPATPLASPWDLVYHDRQLYVAMAGTHQIYRLDLDTREIHLYAGSGIEDLTDDTLSGSAFAQPMGLATDGRQLYVADAESSAIRAVDLPPGNRVRTLVGTGLFDFGDRDGIGDTARLQHDQGLTWLHGQLAVADTYNHKLKIVDPKTRIVTTLFGQSRTPGTSPRFFEPGGVATLGQQVFVADTNHHLIQVGDLASGRLVPLALTF